MEEDEEAAEGLEPADLKVFYRIVNVFATVHVSTACMYDLFRLFY